MALTGCCPPRLGLLVASGGRSAVLPGGYSERGENSMGRGRRRLLAPGSGRVPRVLRSALGPGKPSADDLLRAYRSVSFDMGPGREGGRLYEGRSGSVLSYSALTSIVMIPAATAK